MILCICKIVYGNGDNEFIRLKSQKWEFINDTMSTEVQYASVCDRTICLTIDGTYKFLYILFYFIFAGRSWLSSQRLVSKQAI